jgi:hypothetical protein
MNRCIGDGTDGVFNQGVHSPLEPFGSERGWYRDNQCLIVDGNANRIAQPSFETWARDL